MVITYHGLGLIKVTQGDTTIAFNPIGKDAGVKGARFGADIALVARRAPEWNGVEELTVGSKTPFIIDGAGEYEVAGSFIKGFYVEEELEGDRYINTIYTLLLDGITLCHLGAEKSKVLPEKVTEKIGAIDVLFIPVSSRRPDLLSAGDAYALATELEPKLVVPLFVDGEGEDKKALDAFVKAFGAEVKREDKLTLKKKDLEEKEGELCVLSQN